MPSVVQLPTPSATPMAPHSAVLTKNASSPFLPAASCTATPAFKSVLLEGVKLSEMNVADVLKVNSAEKQSTLDSQIGSSSPRRLIWAFGCRL